MGLSLAMSGCGVEPGLALDSGESDAGIDVDSGDVSADAGDTVPRDSSTSAPFELNTTAFAEGEVIPLRYECGDIIDGPGENISPPLGWTTGPTGTMSYAMVMDDVDSGVVHWVVYDIPVDVRDLPEDRPAGYEPGTPAGSKQAEIQGTGYFGYFGPCSPAGVNTYRWTLHAMERATVTGATVGTTEYDMVGLIEAESLASVSFSGES